MNEKIASIIRHLLTGASAWAVNSEWLSASEADTITRALATALAIIVSRLIIFAAGKVKWSGVKDLLTNDATSKVLMVGLALGTALATGGLVSCSGGDRKIPVRGTVYYRHVESGAKGGLVFEPGRTPKGYVRVPIYDEDSGEVTGWADVEMGGREIEAAK